MAIIIIFECENNNHGCSGLAVEVEVVSAREGRVVSSIGCSTCNEYPWQEAGDVIYLPDWAGSSWEWASDLDEEFVQTDLSCACRTNVRPRDLEDVPVEV